MASAADNRRRLVRSCQDCQVTEPDEPLQVVQRLLDGVATGPTPALADLYEADAVVELPFARPGGLRLEGRAAIRDHFARAAQARLTLLPVAVKLHQTLDPEVVIAEYDYEGRAIETGRSFVVSNVQIIRVRAGRIVASRDFHDHAVMSAAGRDSETS
jgi:ketosteroid isomerase-like protein